MLGKLRATLGKLAGPSVRLYAYPDYETYRSIQQQGNARKLSKTWTTETNVRSIARYADVTLGGVRSILCHGTRNGAELRWFRESLPQDLVLLGTDIAISAADVPDSIVWDFHDLKPEWEGAWDVVYSNSWDHAFDPERAFRAWMHSLRSGGLLVLEHSERHLPSRVSALDPFGATLKGLVRLLDRIDPPVCRVIDVVQLPEAGRHAIIAQSRRSEPALTSPDTD